MATRKASDASSGTSSASDDEEIRSLSRVASPPSRLPVNVIEPTTDQNKDTTKGSSTNILQVPHRVESPTPHDSFLFPHLATLGTPGASGGSPGSAGITEYFHPHPQVDIPPRPSPSPTPGTDRFRASVMKVMNARKGSDILVEIATRSPGAEPGVDPRKSAAQKSYAHIVEKCEIEVVDYSIHDIKFKQMDNAQFLHWLASPESKRHQSTDVRWINVGGISWDVLSALALKYDMHPLSLEDVLHGHKASRSKADYYQKHLFVHILSHSLHERKASPLPRRYSRQNSNDSSIDSSDESEDGHESDSSSSSSCNNQSDSGKTLLRRLTTKKIAGGRRRTAPGRVQEDPEAAPITAPSIASTTTTSSSFSSATRLLWKEKAALLSREGRKKTAKDAQLEALKKRDRVHVLISNVFFFLFRDGTLISFHQADRSFGNPIYARLRSRESILRTDPDASLLLQSCLDLVVDKALEVVEKYHDKIKSFERDILLKPKMSVVRALHILSGDLTVRKRTLTPIKHMIYGLRKYDLERCAAVHAGQSNVKITGYMTARSKIYMADISDHMEYILASLDMYSSMTENLINFAFNMSARATNEIMRMMTLAMVIFLPLTLLTGYFGMNFDPMWAVNENSDAFFWKIAIPVMSVILPLFLWQDIARMIRYFKKQSVLKQVQEKQLKKAKTVKKAEKKRRESLMPQD